ncbi:MAG: F0F1 ATP synthase subunit B [Chloroflexota bacterium]
MLIVGATLSGSYYPWWAAQIVAIIILVWAFLRWRPGFLKGKTVSGTVGDSLDARQKQIRVQLEAAERSREEAAKIQEEARQEIDRAKGEADQIVARAQHAGEAIQQELIDRAGQEAKRIVNQASEEIEYERRQAELALRRRAADIVIDAAGQIVQQNLSSDTDRRIIDESLNQMRNGQ